MPEILTEGHTPQAASEPMEFRRQGQRGATSPVAPRAGIDRSVGSELQRGRLPLGGPALHLRSGAPTDRPPGCRTAPRST